MDGSPDTRLKILDLTPLKHESLGIKRIGFSYGPIPPSHFIVGVDPGGVNMGLAILYPGWTHSLYQVKLPPKMKAVERIKFVPIALKYIFGNLELPLFRVFVEYASFGAKFGQVQLAEARAMAIHFFLERGAKVETVPPLSVYKKVFGSGKIRSQDIWPELPSDAASALGCALYGSLNV